MIQSVVKEYVEKRHAIENEIGLLKEDMKDLDAEYKDQLDLKAVKAALRIIKVRKSSDENLVDTVIKILDATYEQDDTQD